MVSPLFRPVALLSLSWALCVAPQAESPLPAAFHDALGAIQRGQEVRALELAASLGESSPERAYVERQIAAKMLDGGDAALAAELRAGTKSEYVRETLGRLLASHYAREGNRQEYDRLREQAGDDPGYAYRCGDAIFGSPGADEVRRLWFSVEPGEYEVCDHLFRGAVRQGTLTADDVWRQVRLQAGKKRLKTARKAMLLLPQSERPSAQQLSRAISRATRRIKGKHNLDTRARREMVAISAMVAARKSPSLAQGRWAKFEQYFPEATSEDVWLAIAVWSAKFHRGEAPGLFRKAGLELYDDEARAWRVRAGLRAGDWEDVERVVGAMPGEQAALSAWRYWEAVAIGRQGREQEARERMEALAASEDDYYGLLAREELGLDLVPRGQPAAPDLAGATYSEIDFDLGVARVAELAGKRWEGLKIWRSAIERLSPEGKYGAALLAERDGWYLASTFASDTIPEDLDSLDIRFPVPYLDLASEHVEDLGLDLAFVYGLMRQESRFMPNAVSFANAQGLMQVLPSTAKTVARRNRFTKYRTSRLKRPDTNIIIGTHYIEELRESLGDDPILLAAGYNAGPGRPKRWKSRSTGVDRLVFVETIPITQTRLYVKHLLANAAYYDVRFSLREPSILRRAGGSY